MPGLAATQRRQASYSSSVASASERMRAAAAPSPLDTVVRLIISSRCSEPLPSRARGRVTSAMVLGAAMVIDPPP